MENLLIYADMRGDLPNYAESYGTRGGSILNAPEGWSHLTVPEGWKLFYNNNTNVPKLGQLAIYKVGANLVFMKSVL